MELLVKSVRRFYAMRLLPIVSFKPILYLAFTIFSLGCFFFNFSSLNQLLMIADDLPPAHDTHDLIAYSHPQAPESSSSNHHHQNLNTDKNGDHQYSAAPKSYGEAVSKLQQQAQGQRQEQEQEQEQEKAPVSGVKPYNFERYSAEIMNKIKYIRDQSDDDDDDDDDDDNDHAQDHGADRDHNHGQVKSNDDDDDDVNDNDDNDDNHDHGADRDHNHEQLQSNDDNDDDDDDDNDNDDNQNHDHGADRDHNHEQVKSNDDNDNGDNNDNQNHDHGADRDHNHEQVKTNDDNDNDDDVDIAAAAAGVVINSNKDDSDLRLVIKNDQNISTVMVTSTGSISNGSAIVNYIHNSTTTTQDDDHHDDGDNGDDDHQDQIITSIVPITTTTTNNHDDDSDHHADENQNDDNDHHTDENQNDDEDHSDHHADENQKFDDEDHSDHHTDENQKFDGEDHSDHHTDEKQKFDDEDHRDHHTDENQNDEDHSDHHADKNQNDEDHSDHHADKNQNDEDHSNYNDSDEKNKNQNDEDHSDHHADENQNDEDHSNYNDSDEKIIEISESLHSDGHVPPPKEEEEHHTEKHLCSSTNNPVGSCDLTKGTWIRDETPPPYTTDTCSFIHGNQDCVKNGRPDTDYLNWRWQPSDCSLPRFDATVFLEHMRNKKMLFVGDSLARNHMESLFCSLAQVDHIEPGAWWEHMELVNFTFPSYNFTLGGVWAPFLVKHEPEEPGSPNMKLHMDQLHELWVSTMNHYDVVVFSGAYWLYRPSIYYMNNQNVTLVDPDDPAYPQTLTAMKLVWKNVFDHVLSSYNGTFVFRTLSISHFESSSWDQGGTCNKTQPNLMYVDRNNMVLEWQHNEVYRIQRDAFAKAVAENEKRGDGHLRFRLLDVTSNTLLRPDAHPGMYRIQKSSDMRYDCLHWCLPGPMDTWNQLLLADPQIMCS